MYSSVLYQSFSHCTSSFIVQQINDEHKQKWQRVKDSSGALAGSIVSYTRAYIEQLIHWVHLILTTLHNVNKVWVSYCFVKLKFIFTFPHSTEANAQSNADGQSYQL